MIKKFAYILALSILHLYTNNVHAQCEHPDYAGLMEIYTALNGTNWPENETWQEGADGINCDPCEWNRIICKDDRVISLRLSAALVGALPDINLEKLEHLHIQFGSFTNQIPDFSRIPALKELTIESSILNGSIPNFSHLPDLEFLDLTSNNLTGSIPDFDKIPKLKEVNFINNALSGNVPDFQNLTQLAALYFSNNALETIPDFSNLTALRILSLCNNNLSGNIPDFQNLANLESLSLCNNKLTGEIPNFNLKNLKSISLYENELTGHIPDFENLDALEGLSLETNRLSGPVPAFINCPNLKRIQLQNNLLTGTIPSYDHLQISELFLDLSDNLLEGCLPEFICDLVIFDGRGNHLMPRGGDHSYFCFSNPEDQIGAECGGSEYFGVGIIQDDCSCLFETCEEPHPSIESLVNFYNATNGQDWEFTQGWKAAAEGFVCDPCIDHRIYGGWYGLKCNEDGEVIAIDMDSRLDSTFFNLTGNNLTGFLPDLNLPFLEELSLISNNISGDFPDLTSLPKLKKLSLSFNSFTGPLPDFSNNSNLQEFRGSYNQFTGSIPKLSELQNLSVYTVSNNRLEGCFPEGTCVINVFSADSNYAMPWYGNHENYCIGMSEVGAPCIDANGAIGMIDEDCNCTFSSATVDFSEEAVLLFPNPVRNELNIQSETPLSSFSVLDIHGGIIQKGELLQNNINVETFSSGVYFLNLYHKNNEKFLVKRFIKI